MKLVKLYAMQDKLDHFVSVNLGIKEVFHDVEFVDKRVFALKVEIGEFSNEVGWFKYWKQSHVMDREKALEELVDCMHFFLSIGISRKYTFIKEIHPMDWSKPPIESLFQYLLSNNFDSSGQWQSGFEQLICIGYKLGYTTKEMEQVYIQKNTVNYQRQNNGY
jgi:dimeric dUTPase (all-alpha-NTP-PPase superfamily)